MDHVTCSVCGCETAVVGCKCPNCNSEVHEPCEYCGSSRGNDDEVYDWPRCSDCGGC